MRFRLVALPVILAAALGLALASAVTACSSSSSSASTSSAPSSSALASSASASAGDSSAAAQIKANWEAFFSGTTSAAKKISLLQNGQTFAAVIFFTALYLVEVAGASGYRLALIFLPMTVLMISSSVLAGRWTVLVGPRWSITIGCLLLATGLLLVNGYLNPHPDYGPVMTGLGLAGIGIGTTVVPITSAVLAAVPPERSGMAASAANTSREIGAVTGVAILGSLVVSQLRSSLTAQRPARGPVPVCGAHARHRAAHLPSTALPSAGPVRT